MPPLTTTTIVDKNTAILIVAGVDSPFVHSVRSELAKFTPDVYFSSRAPKDLAKFDYCFIVNDKNFILPQSPLPTKIILIFFNDRQRAHRLSQIVSSRNLAGIKIIHVAGENLQPEILDKIFWFSFSQTRESYLQLTAPPKRHQNHQPSLVSYFRAKKILTRRRIFLALSLGILLFHIAFLPPLILSSLLFYKGAKAIASEQISQSESLVDEGGFFFSLAQRLYAPVRPVYLFFSFALPIDAAFDINDKAKTILIQSQLLYRNSREFISLVLKQDKSPQERSFLTLTVLKIQRSLAILKDNSAILEQKIPTQTESFRKVKSELTTATDLVTKLNKLFVFSDTIFAKDTEKKYLLLFANNRELRPGGGFIGSFGTLTVQDYTLKDLKIYDVYDADGQLVAHIEPPAPIRKYLAQPHWFLRDSAFSPDFLENYAQAKFFLEKEVGFKDFSGAVLVTTTALENILSGFGDVTVPDFQEKVNSQNFYLKAQIYAQNNFFPGSIQKKSFLGSLTRQLLINLDTASLKKLASQVKKSLDEKQLVFYLDDPSVQELFNSSYWSGRLIQPNCAQNVSSCFVDYLFPVDANMGVNKANFFISRFANLRVRIDSDGTVRHVFTTRFKNDSPSEVFPGGTYHNYFQLMLPAGSEIKSVTKDGVLVDEVDQKDDQFTTIGFILDVAPKKIVEVRVDYTSKSQIAKGSGAYQLVVQKQIGSSNSDFTFDLTFPQNMNIQEQNISALVKDNRILYNTILSADKIFFINYSKE